MHTKLSIPPLRFGNQALMLKAFASVDPFQVLGRSVAAPKPTLWKAQVWA